MPRPSHSDLTQLLRTVILPFYQVKRDMRVPIGRRRLETDPEHSWGTALMACALAPQVDPALDVGKVCQFAVVHDLVELYAGDTTPFGAKRAVQSKEQREHAALKKIAAETKKFPWIAQTITEYELRRTPEALFVWAIDKYITLLTRHEDQGKFFRTVRMKKEKFHARVAPNRAKAHAHKVVGAYYDELMADIHAHPEYFYEANKS